MRQNNIKKNHAETDAVLLAHPSEKRKNSLKMNSKKYEKARLPFEMLVIPYK